MQCKMKTLERLKCIARKAFLVKVSSNGDSNFMPQIVVGDFGKLKEECKQLLFYQNCHYVSVLTKNITTALQQKINATASYLKFKQLLAEDYSIELAKKEAAQSNFEDHTMELSSNSGSSKLTS
eukprot:TRINITY_DN14856_c0_g1_i2.p1 TRINITY_DN14856_c0_g1~~TRINITY_DN14856_c0_g1_i2.p1  ORF type:complete len:124 (-),score=17.42 TRINITY_DN14856_c0_g1_i2:354-725(-)